MTNTNRAWGAAALFTAFGLVGIWIAVATGTAMIIFLPSLVAYAGLVLQTFFSVRRFSRVLHAASPWQRAADGLLVAVYAGMAYAFVVPTVFLFFFTAMFAVAVVKYASHTPRGPEEAALLHRKILVDAVGCVACLAALGLSVMHPVAGPWAWAIGFSFATFYVLGPGKLYA